MTTHLTILLDGITAGDYLASIRDPEPPALGRDLRSVTVEADPVGPRIDLELMWDRQPPAVEVAVAVAGFPLTPQVTTVQGRWHATDHRATDMHNSQIQIARIQARVDDLHRGAARAGHQRGRHCPSCSADLRPCAPGADRSLDPGPSTRTHS